jgi:cell division protein FtsB
VATRRQTRSTGSAAKPERAKPVPKKRRRTQRTALLLRWCVLGVVVLVGFLYYRPLASYVQTRSALNERAAEVEQLRRERDRLRARLADSATVESLSREARRMGLVRPGEKLYIVKGVGEWRRAQPRRGATIWRDG